MWSHAMVLCPFFSCPSKKQLRVCGVLKKKATDVAETEIENVAVCATGKHQVLPKNMQIR
jgi:hypothetical protein